MSERQTVDQLHAAVVGQHVPLRGGDRRVTMEDGQIAAAFIGGVALGGLFVIAVLRQIRPKD